MSISLTSTGLCKALRIAVISKHPSNIVRVMLSLLNLKHNQFFKLKFYIDSKKDTSESLINEMKTDAHIIISNHDECAKLLDIFISKDVNDD